MRLKPVNVKLNAQRENHWFVNRSKKLKYASVKLISKNVQKEKFGFAQLKSMKRQDLKQRNAFVKEIKIAQQEKLWYAQLKSVR